MSMLSEKICSAENAAELIHDGEVVGVSGFTISGYPKLVPLALAKRAERLHEEGKPFSITLFSGASTGESCDGALINANAIAVRAPYQSNAAIRSSANKGILNYLDIHLGLMGTRVREGYLPAPTTLILEVAHVYDDGRVILSTSGGNTVSFLEKAERIILEVNSRYGEKFAGLHDVFVPDLTPGSAPIPIRKVSDRVAGDSIQLDSNKIVAIVESDCYDEVKPFVQPDSVSETIAGYILEFLASEEKKGRLPKGLAYQSGVGNVANAVLCAMANNPNQGKVNLFTEVIQEACIPLLQNDKLGVASGTALTLSASAQDLFLKNIDNWKKHFVLRQQEISNSAEVIRRVGVVSMNTALECDIFGNVNSSHVCGSAIMNGIGGAADFARNARLGFFMTPSTAKNGAISSIVPLVSHVDHTEHDTMIFVTEQGIADLRGLSAEQRAVQIIENCAHPDYKELLREALKYGKMSAKGLHIPVDLEHAFDFHRNFMKNGSMR
ncbi:MAG: acetyl-CoA hydrolase [Fibrobacter sp.]|nr:acetyl-CoA hydrolase [Fibrobacter sp.]